MSACLCIVAFLVGVCKYNTIQLYVHRVLKNTGCKKRADHFLEGAFFPLHCSAANLQSPFPYVGGGIRTRPGRRNGTRAACDSRTVRLRVY